MDVERWRGCDAGGRVSVAERVRDDDRDASPRLDDDCDRDDEREDDCCC